MQGPRHPAHASSVPRALIRPVQVERSCYPFCVSCYAEVVKRQVDKKAKIEFSEQRGGEDVRKSVDYKIQAKS